MQYLKHRVAVPGTQVPGVQTTVLANVIQRLEMTIGKIDDVNVIAHTGAIDGGGSRCRTRSDARGGRLQPER